MWGTRRVKKNSCHRAVVNLPKAPSFTSLDIFLTAEHFFWDSLLFMKGYNIRSIFQFHKDPSNSTVSKFQSILLTNEFLT